MENYIDFAATIQPEVNYARLSSLVRFKKIDNYDALVNCADGVVCVRPEWYSLFLIGTIRSALCVHFRDISHTLDSRANYSDSIFELNHVSNAQFDFKNPFGWRLNSDSKGFFDLLVRYSKWYASTSLAVKVLSK